MIVQNTINTNKYHIYIYIYIYIYRILHAKYKNNPRNKSRNRIGSNLFIVFDFMKYVR